ncbi:hypothetical protein DFQ27_007902 [Actinomortierella ambigua]|uniref:P-loop containing nucleoside triphosphate hydrolase protein n=1 Tax=Actinomortierella ambigua TaxID=1343610 RepID=A0A9P6QJD6_9FUNG|nr:hypothetical protein DFQ27_007902 [Actinomortierella ambigua]
MPPRYQPPHLRHSNNVSNSNSNGSNGTGGSTNANDAPRNGRKPGPRHQNSNPNRPFPPRDGPFSPDQQQQQQQPVHHVNQHHPQQLPPHSIQPPAHPHSHPPSFSSNGGPYHPPHETGAGHQFRPEGPTSYRPPYRQSYRPSPHQNRPYHYQGGSGSEYWSQESVRGSYGSGSPGAPLMHGKGRGPGANTRTKGKKSGPPQPPPKQIYLYDQAHIERSYNTNHDDSTAEKGERWWENPKNYLQFVCRAIDPQPQFEAVAVPDMPLAYTRIEFKIQTPDPDLIIIGRGDSKSKKEAEKLCALDTCYQLEQHSLIEYYRQYGRGKKSVLKSPKDWAVNFFTNRRQGLPKYINEIDPSTKLVTTTLKLDDITGVGKGATREEAELAAATAFQQMALARGANVSQPGSLEEMGMSLEVARRFVEFYLRTLCLGPPYVDITSSGKTHQALWQAQLMAQDKVLGVGKKRVKKDAENMAYVDAALNIRKEFESIWRQFETTKMVKGKVTDVKPPPMVHLTMDDHMRMDLERLMGQLSREEFFRVRRTNHLADSSMAIDTMSKPQQKPQQHRQSEVKRNPRPLIGEFDIKQMAGKSARLYDQYQAYLRNPSLERIRKGRATLPITAFADEITTKVRENDVVVLVGQTGCGKTTQLPQIILEDYIKNKQGGVCNIICTQPRRIAAISVASRVAVERGESIGHTVGYQVRFESNTPTPGGSILYCTTGIFLRKMHNENSSASGTSFDPLKGVTHIVVDEVHERDIDTDFLLVLLRQMMRDRRAKGLSPIKLILMSATIDTGLFASYFGEGYMDGRCPTISVPGRTFPVQQFYLDELLDSLYKTQSQSEMRQLQNNEQTQRYIAREMQIQPLGPPQQQQHQQRSAHSTGHPSRKPKTMRDDDDGEDDDDDDDDVDDMEIDMAESMLNLARGASRMPRDEVLDAEIPALLLATTIAYIVKTTPASGAILCFVSGWEDMQEVQKHLLNSRLLGVDFNDSSKFRIHMLHSTLPSLSQQEVFEPLTDDRIRKIILATNIAETSITIQDVVHVVDSAKVKETNYDPTKRMTTLLPTWISASSLKQRAGRAGRVQEGQYYSMMSRKRRELLDAFSIPEMLRSDLQEICLHIKSVDQSTKIASVLAEAIQPPDQASVADALSQLMSLGALDANENLTPLGRVLATLPVEPSFGRCLILSCVFSCLDPVLTLCASLGTKDVFVSPPLRKEQADRAKMRWSKDLRSDHLAMMNAYNTWVEMLREEPQRVYEFTDDNYLSRLALENIRRAKAQLLSLLEKSGVVPMMTFERRQKLKQQQQQESEANGGHGGSGGSGLFEMGPPEYNRNSRCVPLLRAMVCAGVFPNISIKTSKKIHRTRHDNVCIVHPGSVNSTRSEKHLMQQQQRGSVDLGESEIGTLLAFSTKVRTSETQIFLRNTTRLDPLSILLFAGGGENEVEVVGQNQIVVDRWWKFNGPERTIRTMRSLREMMTDGLEKLFLILDYKSRKKQQGRVGQSRQRLQKEKELQQQQQKMMRQQFPPLGASTSNGWNGGSSNGGSDYDSNRSSPLGGFYPTTGLSFGVPGVGLGHSGAGGGMYEDEIELEDWIAMMAGDDDKDWMDQSPMAHLVEGLVDLLKQSDEDMTYRQSHHSYYPGNGGSGPNSGRNSSMSFDGGNNNNYYQSYPSHHHHQQQHFPGHHNHHYSPHAYSPYPPPHHHYNPHGYHSNENSRPGSRNGYGPGGGGGGGGGYHNNNGHHNYHHPQPQHPAPPPPPQSTDPREMWTTNAGTGGNMQSWF